MHYIVPKAKFKLIKGKKFLTTYQFNKNIAKHYFCNVCGIKSFYIPRSHPNSISVNARCIDEDTDIGFIFIPASAIIDLEDSTEE